MSVEKIMKKVVYNNPMAIIYRNKRKKALTNDTFSFLCPNCIGGHMYHDLGLQFKSPTINLMMYQTDFVKFVLDLDGYLAKKLEFFVHKDYDFPCAKLGDITVHFTHYKTCEEAEYKWIERSKRLDKDNLFIFASERDGLTKEEIKSLSSVKARGVVVFTAHKYEDIPYTVYIPEYAEEGEVGNILVEKGLSRKRKYENYFDFVKWFNEANGNDYDVSPFSLV